MGQLKDIIEDLNPATAGAGPMLQRDYWAVIRGCTCGPAEVSELVRTRFKDFPPQELVVFTREGDQAGPLQVGDRLGVKITGAPDTAVCVIHADDFSLTLGTVAGHPEAGRITFGAYPNSRGDVIFHIRSRARASSPLHLTGFVAAGEPMQTNTWTDFVDRLAHTVGEGVIGPIHADTREVEPERADEAMDAPTFIARAEGHDG